MLRTLTHPGFVLVAAIAIAVLVLNVPTEKVLTGVVIAVGFLVMYKLLKGMLVFDQGAERRRSAAYFSDYYGRPRE